MNNNRSDQRALEAGCKGTFAASSFITIGEKGCVTSVLHRACWCNVCEACAGHLGLPDTREVRELSCAQLPHCTAVRSGLGHAACTTPPKCCEAHSACSLAIKLAGLGLQKVVSHFDMRVPGLPHITSLCGPTCLVSQAFHVRAETVSRVRTPPHKGSSLQEA